MTEINMSGVTLTDDHREAVANALLFVAPRQHLDFIKQVGDRLRPIRDLRRSDVASACSAVLVKFRQRSSALGLAFNEKMLSRR